MLSDLLTSVLDIVTAVLGSTMPDDNMAERVTQTRGLVGEISFNARYLKSKVLEMGNLTKLFVLTSNGRCP